MHFPPARTHSPSPLSRNTKQTQIQTLTTVLHWYTSHALTSIPLNPTHASITLGTGVTLATLPSPSSLPSPSTTSLSIITPAAATRRVLREARDAGVRAVWMQPGSFGEDELRFAREVWGVGCLAGGGDCVLVHGERGLELVGREREREGRL